VFPSDVATSVERLSQAHGRVSEQVELFVRKQESDARAHFGTSAKHSSVLETSCWVKSVRVCVVRVIETSE
jgi:hypothetical protein